MSWRRTASTATPVPHAQRQVGDLAQPALNPDVPLAPGGGLELVEGKPVIGMHQPGHAGPVRGEAPNHPGLGCVRVHDVEGPAAEHFPEPDQGPQVTAERDGCPQRGLDEDFQPARGGPLEEQRIPAPGDDRHLVGGRVHDERPAQRVLSRTALQPGDDRGHPDHRAPHEPHPG
jgi:hypothetical protein